MHIFFKYVMYHNIVHPRKRFARTMRIVWFLFSLGNAQALVIVPNVLFTNDNRRLIANGDVYSPEDYPYVVGLEIFSARHRRSICSGSIISPLIVVTAAHCTDRARPRNIRVGILLRMYMYLLIIIKRRTYYISR